MTKKHKGIFIAVLVLAFTLAAAAQGRCAGHLSQEARVNKIVDAYEVENLSSALMFLNYMHYYLDEIINIHAANEPDVSGELAPTGKTIGMDHLMSHFGNTDRAKVPVEGSIRGLGSPSEAMPMMGGGDHAEMHIHEMNGMVIEIAGDGQTAQIMFNSTGRENSDWAWIKYGIDCKKYEDGWKIWHTHVYGTIGNSYSQDWADIKGFMGDPGVEMMMPGMGEGGMPDGGMPGGGMPDMGEGGMPGGMMSMSDAPSIERWVYTGGTSDTYSSIPPLWPVPPEPCETWDPDKSY